MVRPCKCRHIGAEPEVRYFKPRGIPCSDLLEVVLTLDEFEAVKLADLEGEYQEKAAGKMKVSRQTFGIIIEKARKKLADAIVNGKALKIEGGVYTFSGRRQIGKRCCKRRENENLLAGGKKRRGKQ